MKIALPTTDNIVVSDNPRESEFFRIVTFRRDELIKEEYRANPLKGDNPGSPITMAEADRLATLLSDCDVIICRKTGRNLHDSPVRYLIKTVFSSESLITKAAGLFNEEYLQQERNTCCSP